MGTRVEDSTSVNTTSPFLSFFDGLRATFYLVTPSESSFETVDEVPDYVGAAIPHFVILIILEMLILYLQGKELRLNDKLTSIGAGMYSEILGLLGLKTIEISLYVHVYNNYRIYDLQWNSMWTWVIMALAYDFLYYWFHRFAHEANVLWNTHQTHHSSEDYTLTTALRQSATQTYGAVFIYLPAALFVPPSVYAVHRQLNLLYQFWIHTELVNNLGPLEYILNTPSHHRVHHGRNPYCIDKNYAAVLIIWDRMFGTFQPELKEEKVVYGLVHPINTFDSNGIQLNHYVTFCQNFWRTSGLLNKIKFIFCGPGWRPGTPRLGNHEEIPAIEQPVTVYNPSISNWLNAYVLVHFILASAIYNLALYHHLTIPYEAILIACLLIVASLTSFGFLFDKRSFAYAVECVRCAACASVTYRYTSQIASYLNLDEMMVLGMCGLFLVSAIVWPLVNTGRRNVKDKPL